MPMFHNHEINQRKKPNNDENRMINSTTHRRHFLFLSQKCARKHTNVCKFHLPKMAEN